MAWTILVAAAIMALIIAIFLRPMGIMTGRIIAAESAKGSVLVESIYGIRTVKALALEPMRAADWDRRVAETADLHIQASKLANWPATLTMPLQRYCSYGVMLLGEVRNPGSVERHHDRTHQTLANRLNRREPAQ